MTWNRRRTQRIVLGAVLSLSSASCAMMGTLVGSASDTMKIASGCPEMSNMDAIAKIDFAKEFSVDAAVAAKLKAGVIASTALKNLAADVDADLKAGCGGLAKDLGATGEFKTGTEACHAAIKVIGETKAKLGASATIAAEIKEPTCSVSVSMVSDCMGQCDASLKGEKPKLKCEGGDLSGKCDADCTGSCTLSAPASCAGTCDGSCDATFSGSCGGSCDGTCDGKKHAPGHCDGKCDGKCDSKAKGECSGNCTGTCQMNAAAKCDGTCSGSCSVEFKEPTCSGTLVPPKVSGDCKAACDAHAGANLSCTPPVIDVKITGTKDLETAAKYKAALQANLPRILKVAKGLLPKLTGVVSNAKTTLDGGISAAQAATKGRATAAGHIAQCLTTPFSSAVESVTNVKATVDVSVDISASATASGSASGAGKAG